MRNSFYLPLLGGPRREDIEIIDVSVADSQGSIDVIGDVFRFTAGPDLEKLAIGVPVLVLITARYLDGDGKDTTTIVPIVAINTPVGVALELPGGRTVQDAALLSPIPVASMLDEPFAIATPKISTSIDESIFVDIFNAANPQFIEAFVAAQQAFVEKSLVAVEAGVAVEEAQNVLELLDNARATRLTAKQFEVQAQFVEQLLQDALDEFSAASSAFSEANLTAVQAQSNLESIGQQLQVLDAQIDVFIAQFTAGTSGAAQKRLEILVVLEQFGLSAPVEQHFDVPGVGPLLKALAGDRDDLQSFADTAAENLAKAESQVQQLTQDFGDAQAALQKATIARVEAQERLEEAADVDFEALEAAALETRAVADLNGAVADQLEALVEVELNIPVPVSQAAVQDATSVFVEATGAKAQADVSVALAEATFQKKKKKKKKKNNLV